MNDIKVGDYIESGFNPKLRVVEVLDTCVICMLDGDYMQPVLMTKVGWQHKLQSEALFRESLNKRNKEQ